MTGTSHPVHNDPGLRAAAEAGLYEDDLPDHVAPGLPPGIRSVIDWIVVVAVALFVAVLVRTYVLAHFVVDGESMLTTLHTSDRVFVNKLSYRLHDPERGDVVVLHELGGGTSERDLIKRVIALPGETIEIENCQVLIDENPDDTLPAKRLVEPYLDPVIAADPDWCVYGPVTVTADHVFVMGDNRPASSDSRQLGLIRYEDIVGRAFVVFWPRNDWQWL